MRPIAHMTHWVRRLAILRLLAAMLVFGLLAPPLTAGTHAHGHGSAGVVTVEATDAASDPAPDDACLACHVHCGCHIGLPSSEARRASLAPAVSKVATPASDRGRLSARTARLIRPPRA